MPNPIELAEGWPHKHFATNPKELHISPRTAYFVQDGKLMFLRLEELTDEDVKAADAALEAHGVTNV